MPLFVCFLNTPQNQCDLFGFLYLRKFCEDSVSLFAPILAFWPPEFSASPLSLAHSLLLNVVRIRSLVVAQKGFRKGLRKRLRKGLRMGLRKGLRKGLRNDFLLEV